MRCMAIHVRKILRHPRSKTQTRRPGRANVQRPSQRYGHCVKVLPIRAGTRTLCALGRPGVNRHFCPLHASQSPCKQLLDDSSHRDVGGNRFVFQTFEQCGANAKTKMDANHFLYGLWRRRDAEINLSPLRGFPRVIGLLDSSSPPTVSRLVVAVVIDAVDAVGGRWLRAHVGEKRIERRGPSRTHIYASGAVPPETWIRGVRAPLLGCVPGRALPRDVDTDAHCVIPAVSSRSSPASTKPRTTSLHVTRKPAGSLFSSRRWASAIRFANSASRRKATLLILLDLAIPSSNATSRYSSSAVVFCLTVAIGRVIIVSSVEQCAGVTGGGGEQRYGAQRQTKRSRQSEGENK